MLTSHRDSLRRAREAGVRIASGSDGGVYGHDFTLELELLVGAGMSPGEAIVAATSRAAECLGWQDEIGAVKPGMKADLLVVNGDPTERHPRPARPAEPPCDQVRDLPRVQLTAERMLRAARAAAYQDPVRPPEGHGTVSLVVRAWLRGRAQRPRSS